MPRRDSRPGSVPMSAPTSRASPGTLRECVAMEESTMAFRPSFLAAGLVLATSLAAAQTLGQPERFTATAISNSPQYGSGEQIVQINVDRWSTPGQRDELVAALMSKGEKELLKDLQKMKSVGTIRTPDSLGYTLRYAFQAPDPDGGRTIVIATDRPIGFW